jgi:hypothetical protein
MIALARQLGHFSGVFTVIAAIILSVRGRAVTGWMLAFLRLCHDVSSVALVAMRQLDDPVRQAVSS